MPTPTVRQLRSRWKPHKLRLNEQSDGHPTAIRFHRACSWLNLVEKMGDQPDHDTALMYQWIAFNSLYGQWDVQAREPANDRQSWRVFMDRILELDETGHVGEVLTEHRKLVASLFDDAFISKYFWEEPSVKRAGKATKVKYDARTWYLEQKWGLILERLLERIYFVRCQLVHGAATHGSSYNRTSVRRCSTMLGHLVPAVLTVITDHGADEDWGPMCYPPISQ